jgi:hypothetical protein
VRRRAEREAIRRVQRSAITRRLAGLTGSYKPKLLLVLKGADEKLGYQVSAESITKYLANLSAAGSQGDSPTATLKNK